MPTYDPQGRIIESVTLGTSSAVIGKVEQSGTWNVGITGTIPLATGAATAALQGTGNTTLANILTALGTTLSAQLTQPLPVGTNSIGSVAQSGTWNINAISSLPALAAGSNTIGNVNQAGTWNLNNISGTISLPTGASTAAHQVTQNGKLDTIISALAGTLAVSVADPVVVTNASNEGLYIRPGTGEVFPVAFTNTSIEVYGTVYSNQSGTWNINNISGTVSLPTGAATGAKQDTGNASLASIVSALGGTLTVNTGADIKTLTGTDALAMAIIGADGNPITSFGGGVQYEDGDSVTSPIGTMCTYWDNNTNEAVVVSVDNPLPTTGAGGGGVQYTTGDTDATPTGTIAMWRDTGNVIKDITASTPLPVVQIGTTTITGSVSISGTPNVGQSGTWNITNISGAISLPTGASTSAKQDTIIGHIDGIETALAGTLNVALTNAIPAGANVIGAVTQSGTWNIGSITTLPSLPAGSNAIGTVGQNGTWNITNISGTITLPTGASTSANQTTIIGHIDGIETALTGTLTVGGNVASAATDSGNPVKVGGRYNSSGITLTNGQRGDLQLNASAHLLVAQGGTWNIGTITTLPSTPAGTNLIGQVVSGDNSATVYAGTTAMTPKWAAVSTSTSGDQSIIALVASRKLRVLAAFLSFAGTVNVKWRSNTTDLTGLTYGIANSGLVLPYNKAGWFETASGQALNLNLSASVGVGGAVQYVEVA